VATVDLDAIPWIKPQVSAYGRPRTSCPLSFWYLIYRSVGSGMWRARDHNGGYSIGTSPWLFHFIGILPYNNHVSRRAQHYMNITFLVCRNYCRGALPSVGALRTNADLTYRAPL
jgi:hypothetical protein